MQKANDKVVSNSFFFLHWEPLQILRKSVYV